MFIVECIPETIQTRSLAMLTVDSALGIDLYNGVLMALRYLVLGAMALITISCTQVKQAPTAVESQEHGMSVAGHGALKSHVVVRPDDVKWMDGPPSLPPGSKFAVLEGDPAKEGFFVMR